MGRLVITWSMKKLIWMITQIVQNKFDCFIVIEGNRGLGKSTFAIHLARGVSREMKKIGSTDYKFNWMNSLIYTKKETKHFWHKWKAIGIGDEMGLITFNRDFYIEDQKDIIKIINTNRDHSNFFVACLPSFQTLDNQIKNLCKIRITVVRRGLAIIQTPNQSIYMRDKWDQQTNEKIEREWMKKGVKHPHYAKLTTFRGVLKFPKLTDLQEEKYQEIKDLKRNIVAREEMGIIDEDEKKTDPVEIMIKMLKDGKVKNGTFVDGFAIANELKPTSFKTKLNTVLRERNEDHQLMNYYWDRKKYKDREETKGLL
jgi:hypothetical protein